MNKRSHSLCRAILAGSITALLSIAQGKAASLTWDITPGDGAAITGGTGTWTDGAGNWNTGAGDANWSNANPDSAIFGDVAGTVSLGGPITVGGITFNTAGYIIQSDVLTLGGVTPTVTANADATISSVLAGTVGLAKAGAGNLTLTNTGNTFSGGLTLGAAAGTITATTNAGTNVTALGTGVVSIGASSTVNLVSAATTAGPTTITNAFTGSGILKVTFLNNTTAKNTVLSNITNFTGTIQLSNVGTNGDKLNLGSVGSQGNIAANFIVDNNSQVYINTGTTNFNGGISIIGTGNSENRGVIRLGPGVLGGNITLAGNSSIGTEGGTLTGNISATGAQTLTLGTTSSTGNSWLSGVLGNGTGTLSLTKTQAGTAYLSGANTYTGATTISTGAIQLGVGQAGGTTGSLSPSSAISIASGASLIFNRSNNISATVDFGAISGAGNVTQNGTGTVNFGGAAVQAYTGTIAVNRGTLTLDFTGLATPTNMLNSGSILSLGGGTLGVVGNATGVTSQTFASTTGAAGRSTVILNRNGGTSANLLLNALTRAAGNTITFQPATAWTTANSTTEIVKITSASTPGGAVTLPGAGTAGYVGAGVFFGSGTGTRYAQVLNTAGVYQLVAGPASTAFVTTGGSASTVYSFTGSQTLTGALTNYAVIANNGATTATIANGGFAYTLNGVLGIQTALTTISGTGAVTIGAERDLIVNLTSSGGLTISSVIANSAGGASSVTVASTGTGVFTPSGANTYTGGTYFNSGTTAITSDGAASAASQLGVVPAAATPGNLTFNGGTLSMAPAAAMTLNTNRGIALGAGGGTLTNTAAQAVTVSSVIAGVGGITYNPTNAAGSFNVGGANTYTGGTTLNGAGTVVAQNNATFGNGGTLTLNGAQLRSSTGSAIVIANPITIAANTTFPTVAAEQTLTFTGATVLGGGSRTLTSGVGSTVGNKSVAFTNSISESVAGSGLTKAGAGEIFFSGVNTYTGPTSVTAGRLTFAKNFSLYNNTPASWTNTNITVSSGATLALRVGGINEFTASDVQTISGLGTATTGFNNGSYIGLDTTSGTFTYGNLIANPNAGTNRLGVMKMGANNLTLSAANTYTGITFVGGGTLVAANPSAFGPSGNDVYFFGSTNAATSGAQITFGNLELATDASVNAYDVFASSSSPASITLSRATSGPAVAHTLGQFTSGNNIYTVQAGTNNASGTPSVNYSGGMNLSAGGAGNSTLNPTTANIFDFGSGEYRHEQRREDPRAGWHQYRQRHLG